MKFAVDQMQNPQSIVIEKGGIFKEGILIAGSIGTISENEHSIIFFKLLSTLIKKEFIKVGTFYVGKYAKQKLDHGWRLVTNEKSPK
ncbi:hypothetical protein OCK74_12160 [Chitinophagaceae bacterium LB-8]|uniref:Uncharacterized protein n=1 Tax=Paraflavisolibacter caeni TaxID=2982496 RepID=A0A9X3B8J8_9BACT|nr:hypothetical protein [Paraflavisolibacter caeni]MCU7549876.1 hypothetical protein [Paraflavisolibacter caeni]